MQSKSEQKLDNPCVILKIPGALGWCKWLALCPLEALLWHLMILGIVGVDHLRVCPWSQYLTRVTSSLYFDESDDESITSITRNNLTNCAAEKSLDVFSIRWFEVFEDLMILFCSGVHCIDTSRVGVYIPAYQKSSCRPCCPCPHTYLLTHAWLYRLYIAQAYRVLSLPTQEPGSNILLSTRNSYYHTFAASIGQIFTHHPNEIFD